MKDTLQQQKKTVPYASILSLKRLIDFWETGIADGALPFNETLLENIRLAPELRGEIGDLDVIEKHRPLVNQLMTAVMAPANGTREVAAAFLPFSFETIFATPAFKRHVHLDQFAHSAEISIEGQDLSLLAGRFILEEHYGVRTPASKSLRLFVHNNVTGLDKVFEITVDRQFCEIIANRPVQRIDPNVIRFLIERPEDRDLWLRYIRPGDFTFRGFLVFRMADVTDHEMESSIKYDLLKKDAVTVHDSFMSIQQKLRSYFNIADLRLTLGYFDDDNNLVRNSEDQTCWEKFGDQDCSFCSTLKGSIYERAWIDKRYVAIPDLARYGFRTPVEETLLNQGTRGLLLAPLIDDEQSIGILELTTTKAGVVNPLCGTKVERLLPMFTAALKRVREELATEVRAIIQEKFTNIHPVVQWRFLQSGRRALESRRRGEAVTFDDIVFENVYPLFGMADVRNSSTTRAAAISHDLLDNFEFARTLLENIRQTKNLPVADELIFKAGHHMRQLSYGPGASDEVNAVEFLRKEIHPLLFHFSDTAEFREPVAQYRRKLDPASGVFYENRRRFENSLAQINQVIGTKLEEAQMTAQQMFPHYFEKHRTDGLEYTVYVGSSLTPGRTFNPFYLNNFRLWQLLLSLDIEREMVRLKLSLPVNLDIAQLILVHDQPLSIRFRSDEKQFDVDGAYDIRYEIVKKRIDKATVKPIGERLTQPGKLAIIYTHPNVIHEYHRYFEYLLARGLITDEVEDLELEELQGATGLRALRVTVAEGNAHAADISDLSANAQLAH